MAGAVRYKSSMLCAAAGLALVIAAGGEAIAAAAAPAAPGAGAPPVSMDSISTPIAAPPPAMAALAAMPTPRTSDGKPDLAGLWTGTLGGRGGNLGSRTQDDGDAFINFPSRGASITNFETDNGLRRKGDRNRPVYKPEFWAKVRDNDYNGNDLDPQYYCRPEGVPRMGSPRQIFTSKDSVAMLYQGSWPAGSGFAGGNYYRVIPTDGRPHNEARIVEEGWRGDPRGVWDGDTLVVETVGFTDESWLSKSGFFHGFKMKVIERFTRQGNLLRYQATIEDPEFLEEPWVMVPNRILVLNTDPNAYVPEDLPCQEMDREHMVSKTRSG
jgi:hypothetical protein